jgi:uncharacterized membrane protein HdeD (DUF308 family)
MKTLIKNWWVMLLLGILFLIAGIIVVAYSTSSLIFFTTFFSVSFLVFGIFEIIFSLSNTHTKNWGWYLIGGILDLLVGVILISSTLFLQMEIFVFFIGFWLLFKGVSLIGHSFDVKNMDVSSWGWLLVLGIIEVFFAFVIVMFPPVGVATLVIWLSLSFIFLGIYYIGLSFSFKNIKNHLG